LNFCISADAALPNYIALHSSPSILQISSLQAPRHPASFAGTAATPETPHAPPLRHRKGQSHASAGKISLAPVMARGGASPHRPPPPYAVTAISTVSDLAKSTNSGQSIGIATVATGRTAITSVVLGYRPGL